MALDGKSTGLSERAIRDARPGPKARILWDGKVQGLGLKIQPGGTKAYVLDYRVGGRQRRVSLGRAGELSLKDARERAGRELTAIRNGEADPLQRRRDARDAPTMGWLIEQFFTIEAPARIKRGRMKPGTVEVYQYQSDKHILPAIGARRIEEVTRADIERMVAPLTGAATRNRVLALSSRLFTLAEKWELRASGSNPTRHVERAREEARDRVLAPSELAALAEALSAAEARSPANVAAIRFAALTGLRIGEVLTVRWEHVDFETGRLTLPDTKTGRRVHDLPTAAAAILADIPRIGDWAFTNNGRAPATYKRVRETFARVAAAGGLDDVRLHDLRRTVMTQAALSGAGAHVLRDLLGHRDTTMADRYIRALSNPVRDTRERVAGTMAAMMAGKAGEVVPLASGRQGS